MLNSGVLYSGVLIGTLIPFGTLVSICLWTRPAAAAAAIRLPLHECRLEHPLRLASIPARCGALEVPEDRTRPGSATIGLSVAVVPALNRQAAAAPVFLLAGGPGQGATAMYASLAAAFARVNRNHDIVLVDQRGTGNSAPLSCDYPDDWQAPDDPMPALRQATLACLHKYGDRVRVVAQSGIPHDLADDATVGGTPAVDVRIWRRMAAIVPRLPAAMRRLRAIEERLGLRSAGEGR